jgi:outer membrane protein assembly factor BamB
MDEISCPHCGQTHPPDLRFCPNTGAPMTEAQTCPHCGEKVEANWEVCAYCGRSLKRKPGLPSLKPKYWVFILGLVGIIAFIVFIWPPIPTPIPTQTPGPLPTQTESIKSQSPIVPPSDLGSIETPSKFATATYPSEESAASRSKPRLIWSDPGFSSKAIVDGIIYGYLYKEDKVQAIEIVTGKIIWQSTLNVADVIGADHDYVYVSPATQRLDALDVNNGEPKWHALLPSRPGKILVTKSNFILVDGLLSHDIFKIDKNNGNILEEWTGQYPLSEDIVIVPYLDSYGNITGMQFVDINTGQVVRDLPNLRWSVERICKHLFIYNNLPSEEGQPSAMLESLDVNTGQLIWSIGIPSGQGLNVYRYGYPRCPGDKYVDEKTGQEISIDPESQHIYVPVVPYDPNNPPEYGYLGALDIQTGELLWVNSDNNYNYWLGEAAGLNIYSQPEFGLVRAYDAQENTLVWENDQVLLAGLVGSTSDTIIGITDNNPNWFGYSGFVGLDARSGELLWELEENQMDERITLFGHFIFSRSNEKKLISVNHRFR